MNNYSIYEKYQKLLNIVKEIAQLDYSEERLIELSQIPDDSHVRISSYDALDARKLLKEIGELK